MVLGEVINSDGGVPIWDLGWASVVLLGLVLVMVLVMVLAFLSGRNR